MKLFATTAVAASVMLAATAACLNVEIPAGARISCSKNADCPDAFACRTEVGLCVRSKSDDTSAPTIANASVTPTTAGLGAQVEVRFTVSEALLAAPQVSLHIGADVRALSMRADGDAFVGAYLTAGDEGAGDHDITATLVDTAGNLAANVVVGRVTFDFTPATITSVDIAPTAARSGSTVRVTVRTDEPATDASVVTLGGAGRPFTLQPIGADPLQRDFTLDVRDTEEAEGDYAIDVRIFDAAANPSAQLLENTVHVDFTLPAVLDARFAAANVAINQIAALTLTMSEPVVGLGVELFLGDLVVPLTLDSSSGTTYFFRHQVIGDVDGTYHVRMTSAVDVAANAIDAAVTLTPTVTIDSTPPLLETFLAPPRVARGAVFFGDIVANEVLQSAPTLILQNGFDVPTVMTVTGSGQVFAFEGTAPLAGANGFYSYVVALVDLAGNVTTTSPGVVEVDNAPPGLAGFDVAPPAAKAGDIVHVVVTATETLAAAPVLSIANAATTLVLAADDATAGRNSYTYQLLISPAVASGTWTFAPFDLVDEANNSAHFDDVHVFDVDSRAPIISNLLVSPPHAKAGSVVTVTFDTDETAQANVVIGAAVAALDNASTATRFVFTTTLVGSEPQGAAGVSVSVQDAAGNVGVAGADVDFDFDPPGVVASSVVPAAARAEDVIAYSFSTDEPVVVSAGSPALTTVPALAFELSGGTLFTFTHRVAADADGAHAARISLVDRAGNSADVTTQTNGAPLAAFTVDTTAPTVALVVSDRIRSKVAGFNTLTLRFDVADASFVTLADAQAGIEVRIGGRVPSGGCMLSGTTLTFSDVCTHVVGTLDSAGAKNVFVRAADAAGNTSVASEIVDFDFTAPAIDGNAITAINGEAGNLNPNPTRIHAGTILRFVIVATEELGTAAVFQTTPSMTIDGTFGTNPLFGIVGRSTASAGQDGPMQVSATLVDRVGNVATNVPLTFSAGDTPIVDVTTPAAAQVNVADRIVYTRTPWGDSNGVHAFSVVGTANAAEPGTIATVSETGSEIARTTVNANGSFTATLDTRDRAVVNVALVDAAGNVSPSASVRDVVWVATMGDKVEGRTIENPHRFTARTFNDKAPVQADEEELLRDSTAPATLNALARLNDANGTLSTVGLPAWRELRAESIVETARPRAAFDAQRGVMVLPGGPTQLREWDGTRLNDVHTIDPQGDGDPDLGTAYELAYDPVRGETVLFGSEGVTWGYDGLSWRVLASAANSPDDRIQQTMAWDPIARAVLLHGGGQNGGANCDASASGCLGDTWLWNGSTWQNITSQDPTENPPVRQGAAMVFNDDANAMVMFGGRAGNAFLTDTWEWTGLWRNATPVAPSVPPPGRNGAAMVHDNVLGGAVMVGGRDASGVALADAWFWDGTDWGPHTFGDPERDGSPSARSDFALVKDTARDVNILHGGTGIGVNCAGNNAACDDTWVGTNASWRRAAPFVNRTRTNLPIARSRFATAYDRTLGKVLMYGGEMQSASATTTDCDVNVANGFCGDFWEFDGAAWTVRAQSGTRPGSRKASSMAFAEAANVTVLFGGLVNGGAAVAQTFHVNAAGVWTRFTPAVTPSARSEAAMVYDPVRQRVVLFGGRSPANVALGDTWDYNPATAVWTQRCNPGCGVGIPLARMNAGITYDRARSRVVLFGGDNGAGTDDDDVFEFDGTTWTRVTTVAPRPIADAGRRLIFDEVRARTQLFGTRAGCNTNACDDAWEYSTGTWRKIAAASPPLDGSPQKRNGAGVVYNAARAETVLFGALSPAFDTWRLESGADTGPAHVFTVVWSAAGVPRSRVRDVALRWRVGASALPNGSPQNGVSLFAYSDGERRILAGNANAAPLALSAPTTAAFVANSVGAPNNVDALFNSDDDMVFFAQPAFKNGSGPAYGALSTDYVEALVRYRLP